jgi:hypothetical protein
MRVAVATLLLALSSAAMATPAAPAPADELQTARALSCAAFQSEVSRHRATGLPRGQTPSFAIIWAALLQAEKAKGGGLGKMAHGDLMYEFTFEACGRNRARSLGATMDEVFARL